MAHGFLLWRISYACRHPISFTDSDVHGGLTDRRKRSLDRCRSTTGTGPVAASLLMAIEQRKAALQQPSSCSCSRPMAQSSSPECGDNWIARDRPHPEPSKRFGLLEGRCGQRSHPRCLSVRAAPLYPPALRPTHGIVARMPQEMPSLCVRPCSCSTCKREPPLPSVAILLAA